MPYTTIDDPTKYFNIKTYTGNLIERAVEGLGHQPDFLWFKNLDTTNSHNVLDSLRGVTKKLEGTDRNNAEGTTSTRLTSFDSDGFTVKTDPSVNGQTNQMCVWSWVCNAGTNENAVSESGNNPANTRQTNTTAGFSMITYTGTGGAGTIAHGLGAEPKLIIVKNRDEAEDWAVYHRNASAAGNDSYLLLSTNGAVATAGTVWNDTSPSSSVFTVGTNNKTNKDSINYVAYCWKEVKGYSKIGTYKGNNNADGPFIYTGFTPAFIIIKNVTDAANWTMYDDKRNPIEGNERDIQLYPDLANAEDSVSTSTLLDICSNGFKIMGNNNKINGDGDSMIYWAFASTPFVTSNGGAANGSTGFTGEIIGNESSFE